MSRTLDGGFHAGRERDSSWKTEEVFHGGGASGEIRLLCRRLRRIARDSDNADQTRRLLALAVILDGGSRGEAARTGGVGLQVIRDWALRFNEGGPEALRTRKAPGKRPILTDEQRTKLAAAVEAGPKPYLDGVVRWRLVDLAQWAHEELGVSVSRQTLGRELRAMGFRKLSARPRRHAQDEDAIAEFKKTSATSSPRSALSMAGRPWRSGSRTKRGSARRTS